MTFSRKRQTRTLLPTVLVVDDEPFLASTVKWMLDARYHVLTIDNPERAWDLLHDGMRFDAILCDLSMPRLTGRELHDRIHELDADQAQRFLLITGGATDHEGADFIERLGDRVLRKPFGLNELTQGIERVIRRPEVASNDDAPEVRRKTSTQS